MNPFHPNDAEAVSETDLIAFHLHELSPEQERAILRAMADNSALVAESESVAASLIALKDVPMHVDHTVLERNWKALRPSLIPHVRPLMPTRRWRLPVFAGAAAAFAATLAFFLTPRLSAPSGNRQANSSTPHPDRTLPQNQIPTNQQAGSNDAVSEMGSLPLVKAHLHTGLLRSEPSQPEAPIHLLSLAQTPSMPPPLPRLTPSPAPLIANSPDAPSRTSTDQPDSSIPDRTQPQGSKRTKPGATVKAHRDHTIDVMLAIGGNFIAPHTAVIATTERSTQSATHAIEAVGALHQQFRPVLGYRITVSYSRPDFNYTYGSTGEVNSRIYEVAGTYVVQGPHRRRLSTSADAGVGLMAFLPIPTQSTSYVYRVSGVLGVNVDYAIANHWGARLAYRAQVFKGPDFRYIGDSIPVTTYTTVSNEPSLGVVYTFGKK